MKKRTRIFCGIIAAVLVALFVGGIIFSAVAYAAGPTEKSETVYVTADASGKPISILSSIYVTNPEKLAVVTDETSLTDVRNTGGTDAPKRNGNRYEFSADGEDVLYQGVAGGELPVNMEITYRMNGRVLSPEAMRGKAGRASITVRFENLHKQNAMVEGESLPLYTPFTAVTMLTLDEGFENITVENAKTMTEAGVTTVTGILFPGLAANLETEAKDQLAESFTVEADVKSFALESITAIVMTGIVNAEDLRDLNDLTEMIDGVDEMSDAGDELYKGTKDLYKGVREFGDGIDEYIDGIVKMRDGLPDAVDGAGQLYRGAWELKDGVGEIEKGLKAMLDGLESGGGMPNIDLNKEATVQQIAAGLADGLTNSNLYGAMVQMAEAQGIELALSQMPPGSTAENIPEEILAGIKASAKAEVDASIAAMASGMAEQVFNNMAASITPAIQNAMAPMLKQLKDGLTQLTDGTKELQKGMREWADGMHELQQGMVELYDGANTLAEEGQKLIDGADELIDGVRELNKGVKEFNEEGLKELAANTKDMNLVLERKDAMAALGEAYESYSGKPEGVKGTVKFVFETESIFVEKPLAAPGTDPSGASIPADTEAANEPGFFTKIWNWIKGLFGAA